MTESTRATEAATGEGRTRRTGAGGPGPTRRRMKRFYPRADLKTRIVALPDHRLVYVKNPKAASSTVMLWLDRLHTGDYAFDTEKAHADNHLPTADAIGWDVVSDMLRGSAYRFTFVREPLGRFESAYHNKVARLGRWRMKVQSLLDLPRDQDAAVSFEQFLTAVEQQDPLEMDLHWRPQHLNLMHPLVTYDLVGHVETFDRDIATIHREVELPEVVLESRNVSTSKPEASVYDGRPDLVRRVKEFFREDFEIYGY
jgi:hypothetical protein